VLDKTGSLPDSFPVQIVYRIVTYRSVDTPWRLAKTISRMCLKQFTVWSIKTHQILLCITSANV